MNFPSEQDFGLLLIQLFVTLSAALGLGELFRRLGQAQVIGEVMAGVLLGPSVLGALSPNAFVSLFPPAQTPLLGTIAWLGSVFLLLVAGTEVDLGTIRKKKRVIFVTSIISILLPFGLGFAFAMHLPDAYLKDPAQRLTFTLFVATAISISAIPLVAKILMDLKLLKTQFGQTVMGCAVINDLVGWIFFVTILSLITGVGARERSVTTVALLTVGFSVATLTVGKQLTERLFAAFHRRNFLSEGILGIAVLIAFISAGITQ